MMDDEYEYVLAHDLRVGDEVFWGGEITRIESKGESLRVHTDEINRHGIGYHCQDEVRIVKRPNLGKTLWVLVGYVEYGYDDGIWQQHLAVFEDPADAMIDGDNEFDVNHEWTWVEAEQHFHGAPRSGASYPWDYLYVESITFWEQS